MKIILVGTTGFIGSAILRQILTSHPEITTIIILSRRALPASLADHPTTDPRIKNLIIEDFSSYGPSVLTELSGASACIWSLGGRLPQFPTKEVAHAANVTFPHYAARILAKEVAPSAPGGYFRFVYCSGMFTEYDQEARLLFMAESRKLKGLGETGLLEIEQEAERGFEVLIARPAGVLEKDGGLQKLIYGSMGIGKEVLAAAMVEMAVNGTERRGDGKVVESGELRAWGRELLKAGGK